MRNTSRLLRYATLVLVTVLVARVYCASALPHQNYRAESNRDSFLHLGQTLALADFDGDSRVDEATLGGIGRNKNIEIRLTHAKAPTFLHFDTQTSEPGSLFASDIDNDGDNDLIWSDLLHPDDVVIWLDDGSGRFERVCPDEYAEEFVISNAPGVGGFEIPRLEFAFSSRHDPSLDRSIAPQIGVPPVPLIFSNTSPVAVHPVVPGTPSGRGPPSLS